MRGAIITLACVLMFSVASYPATLHVPGEYPTITDAIKAASNGDQILVSPGTYEEDIDFGNKTLVLRSTDGPESTVIPGFHLVKFHGGQGPDAVLDGFWLYWTPTLTCVGASPTISNNIIEHCMGSIKGGGISCEQGASPCIMNNVIKDNQVGAMWHMESYGGGIYLDHDCSPTIINNVITGNQTELNYASYGSAIYGGTSVLIAGNVIMSNRAAVNDGCIICGDNSVITGNIIAHNLDGGLLCGTGSQVINNTIADNSGTGIDCYKSQSYSITVSNCIVWGNSYGILVQYASNAVVTNSDVQEGYSGSGNIKKNPLFAGSEDYHLTYPSPCRDTGGNAAVMDAWDFEGDPRIADGTVDMGADEFYRHLYITGDKTPGGIVEAHLIGHPGTNPLALFIGSGLLPHPIPSKWGAYYLQYPWLLIPLIPLQIPADGILTVSGQVYPEPAPPYDMPIQALIGLNPDSFSNLEIMKVR